MTRPADGNRLRRSFRKLTDFVRTAGNRDGGIIIIIADATDTCSIYSTIRPTYNFDYVEVISTVANLSTTRGKVLT